MSSTKTIGQLPVAAAIPDAALFEIEAAGVSSKVTYAQVKGAVLSGFETPATMDVQDRVTAAETSINNLREAIGSATSAASSAASSEAARQAAVAAFGASQAAATASQVAQNTASTAATQSQTALTRAGAAADTAAAARDLATSAAAASSAAQAAATTAENQAVAANDLASSSATAAAASAASGAGSASIASSAASDAGQSATSASAYSNTAAIHAADSLTSSAASATSSSAASASQTAASQSASAAQSARLDAQTAAGAASLSQMSSAASASDAAGSRTNAAQSATLAAGSANAAGSASGQASTYSTNAASSAADAAQSENSAATSAGLASASQSAAGGSAASAAGQASIATSAASQASQSANSASSASNTAMLSAASMFPSTLAAGQPWTSSAVGSPSAASILPATSYASVAGIGPVYDSGAAGGFVALAPVGVVVPEPGRTYEAEIRFRVTAASAITSAHCVTELQFVGLDANYLESGPYPSGAPPGYVNLLDSGAVRDWTTFKVRYTAPATPDAAFFRPRWFGNWGQGTGPDGNARYQVAYFRVGDVSDVLASATSASGAAASKTGADTSASAANQSQLNAQTAAGQASAAQAASAASASSALGSSNSAATSATLAASSANTAGTAAGQASTSASQAVTSASGAAGSANLAATYSSNAAGARDAAGNSANAAAQSATVASGQANAAGVSATAAQSYSLTAQGYSSQASGSASSASSSSAAASSAAAAAQSSATLSASVAPGYLDQNPSFSAWSGALPDSWAAWSLDGGSMQRVGGLNGRPYALNCTAVANLNLGVMQSIEHAFGKFIFGCTVEADDYQGAGLLCYATHGAYGSIINSSALNFGSQPDNSGWQSAGDGGRYRRTFTQYFETNIDGGIDHFTLYAMANWDGFGARHAKNLTFHEVWMRPANDSEMKAQRADANATSALAQITYQAGVAASATAAVASQTNSLSATVGSLSASVTTSQGAIATLNGRTGAYLSETAVSAAGIATLSVVSSNGGFVGAVIDGSLDVTGNINVRGAITAGGLSFGSQGAVSVASIQDVTIGNQGGWQVFEQVEIKSMNGQPIVGRMSCVASAPNQDSADIFMRIRRDDGTIIKDCAARTGLAFKIWNPGTSISFDFIDSVPAGRDTTYFAEYELSSGGGLVNLDSRYMSVQEQARQFYQTTNITVAPVAGAPPAGPGTGTAGGGSINGLAGGLRFGLQDYQ